MGTGHPLSKAGPGDPQLKIFHTPREKSPRWNGVGTGAGTEDCGKDRRESLFCRRNREGTAGSRRYWKGGRSIPLQETHRSVRDSEHCPGGAGGKDGPFERGPQKDHAGGKCHRQGFCVSSPEEHHGVGRRAEGSPNQPGRARDSL